MKRKGSYSLLIWVWQFIRSPILDSRSSILYRDFASCCFSRSSEQLKWFAPRNSLTVNKWERKTIITLKTHLWANFLPDHKWSNHPRAMWWFKQLQSWLVTSSVFCRQWGITWRRSRIHIVLISFKHFLMKFFLPVLCKTVNKVSCQLLQPRSYGKWKQLKTVNRHKLVPSPFAEQEINRTGVKPRLHERFFACDGDAIFLKLSRRQHAAKIASVATLWKRPRFCRKKFNSLNFSRFFSAIFSCVASPVRGWLHMRFSPRAGGATIFQKIASPSQAKNRSCSRGLMCGMCGSKGYGFRSVLVWNRG